MRVAVTNAKGQSTELVRRAEAGEEVILTRHGQAVVRLVLVEAAVAPEARRKLLEAYVRPGLSWTPKMRQVAKVEPCPRKRG